MRRRFFALGALLSGAAVSVAFVLAPSTSSGVAAKAPSLPGAVLSSATIANGGAELALGKTLYDQSCSSCHALNAQGSALAPNLRGLGSATIDLWVSSGWMPLAQPTSEPIKKPALFNRQQTLAIADYVGSLTPGQGIAIPTVNLKNASVSEGFDLFSLNCAPCHTITGAGDALSGGLSAPPLHGITPEEVDEAVITGPGNMPRFTPGALTTSQVASVVAYVTRYIEHPVNPGGFGLGGVGPVAEGFIGLFIGVGTCMLVGLWIGDRSERDDADGHDDTDGHDGHDGDGHDGDGLTPTHNEEEVVHA